MARSGSELQRSSCGVCSAARHLLPTRPARARAASAPASLNNKAR